MMKTKIFVILYCMVILFMLVSCSQKDEESNFPESSSLYKVSLIVNAETNCFNTKSVDAEGADAGSSLEWVKSWTLLIVDNSTGKIEKILSRPASEIGLIQSEKYDVNLSLGEKTIFALGNLTLAQAGINYTEGTVLSNSDITDLKEFSYDMPTGNGFLINPASNAYLSMSNIVTINVTNAQQQSFDVPLYRMLAKIEFDFTSDAADDITVTDVKLAPITERHIFLFPSHVSFDADRTDYRYAPLFPSGSSTIEYSSGWNSDNVIPKGATMPKSVSFYLNESKGSVYSKHIVFTLTTQRNGQESEDNYVLTDFSYINRNDFVKIPVILTDYIFDPTIDYYPPIGGYPDVKVSDNKSYFVFYSGGGEFVLTPNLRKSNTSDVISPKNITLTIDSGASIFSANPTYDNVDGVIRGELNGTKGTALITLSMNVSTGVSSVERILTRKIYLVVE